VAKDWGHTKWTPTTVPNTWLNAVIAFQHFKTTAGAADLAIIDMRRALCTGAVESMALRSTKTGWQKKTLDPQFWREIKMAVGYDENKNETIALGTPKILVDATLRGERWCFFLVAKGVRAACRLTHTADGTSRERLSKEGLAKDALEALSRTGRLDGRTYEQILKDINDSSMPDGVSISMAVLKRAFKSRRGGAL
jgi:hypothetical protein